MSDQTAEITSPHHRFILPAIILGCVIVVLCLFFLGYKSLTEPETPPENIQSILAKSREAAKEEELIQPEEPIEVPENATLRDDGTFDFAKFRYFTFPLPFVINLENASGTLTAEVALATYATTLPGEQMIEQLQSLIPKMRSKINLIVSDHGAEELDSVLKRKVLSNKLLKAVRDIAEPREPAESKEIEDNKDNVEPEESYIITDFHFIKFVITRAF